MARRSQLVRVVEVGIANPLNDMQVLNDAVAALAQEAARTRIDNANIAALTDSSTGTPNGSNVLPLLTLPTITTVDGTTLMAPKAGFDTAVAAILAAQHELQEKLKTIVAKVSAPRNVAGLTGTANGTIEAITSLLTGVATVTCVEAGTARARLTTLRQNNSALNSILNYCRVATGMSTIQDNTKLSFGTDSSGVALVNAAATGAAVTTGGASVPEVATETYLVGLVNQIATLAKGVNDLVNIVATNGGPLVVAVQHAHSRTKFGDVDFTA